MKKLLPFFIIISLLFSACSIDWNDEKDKKINNLEQEIQELKKDGRMDEEKLNFEKRKYIETKIEEYNQDCPYNLHKDIRHLNPSCKKLDSLQLELQTYN